MRRGPGGSSSWATPLAGVVSGLLFALSFPPVGWVVLLPLALTPWLVALRREESAGRALWSGILFGLAYWCASIPWIVYVVTHYGGQSPALGVVSLVILAGILAEWPALVAWAAVRAAPAGSGWRLAAFPLLWMASEHARSFVYKGFPWNLTAHALYRHPIWLQTASVWGAFGVGALVTAVTALLAAAASRPHGRAAERRIAAPVRSPGPPPSPSPPEDSGPGGSHGRFEESEARLARRRSSSCSPT